MSMMSLRNRVVLMAVGVAVVASAALIFVGYQINLIEVGEALRGRAGAIAQRLDLFGADGSEFPDPGKRRSTAGSNQSFVAAVVFSPNREIIAPAPRRRCWDRFVVVARIRGAIEAVESKETKALAVAVPLATGGRAWIVFDRDRTPQAESRLRQVGRLSDRVRFWCDDDRLGAGGATRKRLHSIRDTVERLGSGDLEARCVENGPAEILEVARGVNKMAANMDALMKELGHERSALEQQVSGRTRELEQANRLLMDIANRDALTGLANRRRLEMELERNISFSKRTGQPLAVIMMDLDNFKIVNDTAGHLVGDNILRAVASTLAVPGAGHRSGGSLGWRRVLHPGPGDPGSGRHRGGREPRRRRQGSDLRGEAPRTASGADGVGRCGLLPRGRRGPPHLDPQRRCRSLPGQGDGPRAGAEIFARFFQRLSAPLSDRSTQ